ncbi:MAG: electron transport complex subunit RsxE [Oscillospiraceae bacterium]
MTKLQNLLKGLIKENPVLVLVLGTCPTLAISTSVTAAFGMGIAATVVLILSNMAISALRKVIPDTVRIPCYITVIAGFVTIVELVMEAYTYELYQSLGVYLALIVVNCIILGRAEMYANKHGVVDSAIDGLGMGLGVYAGAVRDGDHPRNSRRHLLRYAHSLVFTTTPSAFLPWRPAASSCSAA